MSRKWTEAQTDAINARRGSVLVSAAAGSGKTAVLVERVIRRLTDPVNPTDADRLLIVTFTRAAAGEMKERISAAVSALLRQDPGNARLINQQMLLPAAKICTIDSFCSGLVKENFQLLDISPDFKTADEGELSVLKKQAMDITLEQMYSKGDEGFLSLVELLFQGRDDSFIEKQVSRFYEISRSFPFPEKWLEGLCEPFLKKDKLKDSIYGSMVLSYIEAAVQYSLDMFNDILSQAEGNEDLEKMFSAAVSLDVTQCEHILRKVQNGEWDALRLSVSRYEAKRRGNTPKHLKDDLYTARLVDMRKKAADNIKELTDFLCCSEEDFYGDMEFFAPAVRGLVETVMLYSEVYGKIKKEKKLADFSDITHMALSLLVRQTEDGFESTEFAKSISESFDEILIDEYQDTNRAQDMLFSSISRNNLFRVGDVKQSIYAFRQAMPQIFLEIKSRYESYDREKDNYPAKIILGNNFRSRKGVTDIINFVFEGIMSEKSGDIEYNEEEALVCSAQYNDREEADCEVHIISTENLDRDEETSDEYQARYIAKQIKEMISRGLTVKDGDTERKATYKDFAVLLRSVSTKGIIYADMFRKEGVPCFTEISDSYLTAKEIALILNILRVIDNPKQDVALMSVMMSPVFGFSVDEISQLRKGRRKGDIYSCVLALEGEGNAEIRRFTEKINLWRSMSICLSTSELIHEIYEDTSLCEIFDAIDKSGTKRANLMLFLDYAAVYERSGYIGFSGFIRFIDRLSGEKQDLSGALNSSQNADVVKIMTIHKSKGLEFPVCILANCAGKFNRSDEKESLVLNRDMGVGIIRRDAETYDQYDTLCHKAVKLSVHHDTLSEELRVLYVAMTRAREKLIMVFGDNNPTGTVKSCALDINEKSRRINPFAVRRAKGFGQWLLTALLRHKDMKSLREQAGLDEGCVLPCVSSLKIVTDNAVSMQQQQRENTADAESDKEFLQLVRERAEFRYKYEALSGVLSKRAASEVDKGYIDRDYFASSAPAFLSDGGLTGAQRGIATHTFVQFADYSRARDDLEGEIELLTKRGVLTPVQAKGINRKALHSFFESELFGRMLKSPNVMREKKFTIEVPVSEIYPELSEFSDEMMMIQGIADCAFEENGEIVVVDYKTDALETDEQFREKYSSQVLIYKKALSLCIGLPIKQTLLYSFHLSREIEVE